MAKYDDIIAAASLLFTKYGYGKVTMNEIAHKAGVSKKTIYSYFKDKQELFQYFITEELKNIKIKIEMIDKKNETFLEKVNENLQNILTIGSDNKLLSALIAEKREENHNNESFFKVYEDKIIFYIEQLIEKEIKNGNIKSCDAHLCAFVIYKTVYSLAFEYDKEVDNKKIIHNVTEILKNGLVTNQGGKL